MPITYHLVSWLINFYILFIYVALSLYSISSQSFMMHFLATQVALFLYCWPWVFRIIRARKNLNKGKKEVFRLAMVFTSFATLIMIKGHGMKITILDLLTRDVPHAIFYLFKGFLAIEVLAIFGFVYFAMSKAVNNQWIYSGGTPYQEQVGRQKLKKV